MRRVHWHYRVAGDPSGSVVELGRELVVKERKPAAVSRRSHAASSGVGGSDKAAMQWAIESEDR